MDKIGVDSMNGDQETGVINGGGIGEDEVDESKKLLLPKKGGLRKKSGKKHRRSVQWNDRNGNKLTEVLEYEPSDGSDSEDEDADSCLCNIM